MLGIDPSAAASLVWMLALALFGAVHAIGGDHEAALLAGNRVVCVAIFADSLAGYVRRSRRSSLRSRMDSERLAVVLVAVLTDLLRTRD